MFTILGADGKEYGPVTAVTIAEWIADGRANLQTKVRRTGEAGWRTLGDFAEFNPAAARPPGPGPAALPDAMAASVATLILAGRGQRLGAALIEGFLQTLCKIPVILAFLQMFREIAKNPDGVRPEQFTGLLLEAYAQTVPLLGLYVVIQITLLCTRSQSIGKLLFRLRIVDVQHEQPGGPLRAFLLRGFLVTLIEMIPLLGLAFWVVDSCFIFREDRRCLHDLIAGTKVVRV